MPKKKPHRIGKKPLKTSRLSKKIEKPEKGRGPEYWASRTPEERVEEVARLQRQRCMELYGYIPRIKKVVRIINLKDDI